MMRIISLLNMQFIAGKQYFRQTKRKKHNDKKDEANHLYWYTLLMYNIRK